jgi:hypothetical protein
MLSLRAQAAMEYLTTYGWMILVVVGVLSALYYIGAFNSSTYSARAIAGACYVYRPYGVGREQLIALQGVCNNLEPKSVAQFNGQTGYITTGTTGFPLGNSLRSGFAWIRLAKVPYSGSIDVIMDYGSTVGEEYSGMYINSGGFLTFTYYGSDFVTTFKPVVNAWSFVGYTYSGGANVIVYDNGQSQTGTIPTLNTVIPSSDPSDIGRASNNYINLADNFNGSIADVQLYNTSLSANEINELYIEGIGGAPIRLQNIVGWWPLNGNANDYSGNGNSGAVSNNGVIFSTAWTSGYVQP